MKKLFILGLLLFCSSNLFADLTKKEYNALPKDRQKLADDIKRASIRWQANFDSVSCFVFTVNQFKIKWETLKENIDLFIRNYNRPYSPLKRFNPPLIGKNYLDLYFYALEGYWNPKQYSDIKQDLLQYAFSGGNGVEFLLDTNLDKFIEVYNAHCPVNVNQLKKREN